MKNQQMLRVILRNQVAQKKKKPKSLGKEYKAVVGLKEDFILGQRKPEYICHERKRADAEQGKMQVRE